MVVASDCDDGLVDARREASEQVSLPKHSSGTRDIADRAHGPVAARVETLQHHRNSVAHDTLDRGTALRVAVIERLSVGDTIE
jgi:hypothetical protein